MDSIFHERQQGQLCAQHCINNLLQGPFFNAIDLSKLATELDEAEKTTLIEGGMDVANLEKIMKQPSSNMDDSGFFSVQVINKALAVWSLSMVPLSSPSMKEAMDQPTSCQAFICHQDQHWFTIRKLGKQWFNLDSMKKRPELVSDTYLRLFLAQLQLEGYTIFVIEGPLPSCEADELLSLISVQSAAPTPSTSSSKTSFADALTSFFMGPSRGPPQGGHRSKKEEEGFQLKLASALSASMNPGDTRALHDQKGDEVGVDVLNEGVVGSGDEEKEMYEVEMTAALHASLEDQLETEDQVTEEQREEKGNSPPQDSKDSSGTIEDTEDSQSVNLEELREKRLQHFTDQ